MKHNQPTLVISTLDGRYQKKAAFPSVPSPPVSHVPKNSCYRFCHQCGVDVSIFSHEDHCSYAKNR
ncbi:hypothetical protein CLU79DRAFT_750919 [Phycomyces nitens]|nr:hypothetical protein CLU79DRAFT_750919 [Phycomyces nitens]